MQETYELHAIGRVSSTLRELDEAPGQGSEGAPDVWLEVEPAYASNPLTRVFSTRSSDRPNPLGLHSVTVRETAGARLRVGPIEAIDGTSVVDIKPVMPGE